MNKETITFYHRPRWDYGEEKPSNRWVESTKAISGGFRHLEKDLYYVPFAINILQGIVMAGPYSYFRKVGDAYYFMGVSDKLEVV